ncbi:MFS transporter [Phaeospirillum tilakii]|uniref:MFS transporter n=1 Tax=Phaeospirillum tilakii TaxID=741673 RepID=A0ABW5C9Y8_9PROT
MFDLLRTSRDVRAFAGIRAGMALATQLQAVAVGWHVYDLTGDAWDLGMVGLVQFLPGVLLFPLIGLVADRFDRRRVVALGLWTQALASLGLVWLVTRPDLGLAPLFALMAVLGGARAFILPALSSLLPNLVPRGIFQRVVALGSSMAQFATIFGPAAGGVLYAADPLAPFALAALVAVGSAALALGLSPANAPVARDGGDDGVLAGLRYLRAHPVLLGAISLDLFAVLLGGATALLPIYARDILMVGPVGLGLLRCAPAVGAALVGFRLARRPLGRHAGAVMLACVAGFGLATIVFALSRSMALSLAALVVLGGCDMVSMVVRQTLVQIGTPDAMRGRVSAVSFLFIGATNQLGEFESGATAAWLGVVPAALLGGIGTLAVVALWGVLFPALRRIDRLSDAAPR